MIFYLNVTINPLPKNMKNVKDTNKNHTSQEKGKNMAEKEMRIITLSSKELAGFENNFEHVVHTAAYKLLSDCTGGNPGINYKEFEESIFDYGIKFQEKAYELFKYLGFDINNDGTFF